MSAARLRRASDGFTLLEVLVAVAILALLVAIIPRSFVYARAIINRSESWTEARLVADAVLNGILAEGGLQPGTRSGVIDGRSWVADVTRNTALGAQGSAGKRVLLDVRLSVMVSARENLTVETMRVSGDP